METLVRSAFTDLTNYWKRTNASLRDHVSKSLDQIFYVPEAYLTHLSYCCLFPICSVQRAREGKWGGGALLPSPSLSCRDEVNTLCPGGGGRGWLAELCHFVNSYIPIPHSSPFPPSLQVPSAGTKARIQTFTDFWGVFLLFRGFSCHQIFRNNVNDTMDLFFNS